MDNLIFFDLIREELQKRALHINCRQLRVFAFRIFRISKEMVNFILGEIGPYKPTGQRITSIPKTLRLCTALQFLAQGSYQKAVGQDFLLTMSQSSVSRCLMEVTNLIVEHLGYLVHFPASEEERNTEKLVFMEMENGFPGIIGCVDGTHIAIFSPKTNDPEHPGVIYYCRKNFYSLNVQIVCNAQLKISSINARFPGSDHDAGIWQMSRCKEELRQNYDNGDHNTYLLGDSEYPLEPWLMTPVLRPTTANERSYNRAHRHIRNVVERCNGVLKQRFRCLFKHRVLNYSPQRAGMIINTCAILHNICVERNEELDDYEENDHDGDEVGEDIGNVGAIRGNMIRSRVIEQYF